MIGKSGMPENYRDRLEQRSDNAAHLNYHDLECGCHFQVDLKKQDGAWRVDRVWLCR